MRLHFTVTRFRISILVLNGLLALAVPAFAAYRYLGMGKQKDTVASVNKLHPPGAFTPLEPAGKPGQGKTSRDEIIDVVVRLIPPPPARLPPPPPPPPGNGEPQLPGPGEYQPGPLADEPYSFEYTGFIVRADPMRTQVWLQRQAAGPQPSRGKRLAGKGAARAAERIPLFVGERQYVDHELGLHFWIHSADSERLVYWMHEDIDKPAKTLHALPFVNRRTAAPREVTGAAGTGKRQTSWRWYDSRRVEETMEADYQDIFHGEKSFKDSKIFSEDAGAETIDLLPRKNQER